MAQPIKCLLQLQVPLTDQAGWDAPVILTLRRQSRLMPAPPWLVSIARLVSSRFTELIASLSPESIPRVTLLHGGVINRL